MKSIINGGNNEIVLTDEAVDILLDYTKKPGLADKADYYVLTDEHTHKYCYPVILSDHLPHLKVLSIPAGEQFKSLATCENVYAGLLKTGADRNSILINLGGGVVTDIGGFVASTFKRGIKFINIPTSLLAMVDASSGGKTGVDFNSLKNIIGTFTNADLVIIDPVFLKTLPDIEWKCGFVEMIKHALLDDLQHWVNLKSICDKIDNGLLNEEIKKNIIDNIHDSVYFKNNVVTADYKEQNIRKYLNFGHTIGHAIESMLLNSNVDEIRHGEAVSIGMICETYLSYKLCELNEDKMHEIHFSLNRLFPRRSFTPEQINQILVAIKNDKKSEGGKVSFALLNDFGSPELNSEVTDKDIIESVNYYNNL